MAHDEVLDGRQGRALWDRMRCNFTKGCVISSILLLLLTVAVVCIVITRSTLLHTKADIHRRSVSNSPVGPLRYRSKRSLSYLHYKSHHNKSLSVAGRARTLPTRGVPMSYKVIVDPKKYVYKSIRLPGDLIPLEYHLDFNLDLNNDEFNGIVQMKLDCENPTNKIIFHGRNITLVNITILSGHTEIDIDQISYIPEYEMFIVKTEGQLEEDKIYEVLIEYRAKYSIKLGGLYKSRYTDNGVKKTMVSSHFEPTDARSAFPCFDEPSFKATFVVSITHVKNLTALSNSPIESAEDLEHNTTVSTVFAPTLKMSTYLVALSLNDYVFDEGVSHSGVKIRVYGRDEDKDRLRFATDTTIKVLDFYERFLNKTYPLKKCDLLAVPDFQSGAMEDWGLVSFRSALLVMDRDFTTAEYRRTGALVIAHELAHQWFGNLVTMKWWNGIWLNEGFASFFELLAIDDVYKDYLPFEIQKSSGWMKAISLDTYRNTHPLRGKDINTNFEVSEMFDPITYSKGASILHMLSGVLGNKFQIGLKRYLDEFEYGAATTEDLWSSFEEVFDDLASIKETMDTWVLQPNFPVVTVQRLTKTSFKLSQESILTAKQRVVDEFKRKNGTTNGRNITDGSIWHIPFTFITDINQTESLVWFNTKEMMLNFTSEISWLKGNIGARGFYIVNYDKDDLKMLTKQLIHNKEKIKPVDRANLIHDSFRLACERIIDPFMALNLSEYIQYEMDYLPVSMFRLSSECIGRLLQDKALKLNYSRFVWESQSHLVIPEMIIDHSNASRLSTETRMLRMETMVYALRRNESKSIKCKVEEIFDKMYHNESIENVSPENRLLALMFGFDVNNTDHYDFIWRMYLNSPMDTDRRILSKSIAQFKKQVNVTLARSLNTSWVRVQDTGTMLAQLNHVGFMKEVWEFLITHYNSFLERYGHSHDLSKLIIEFSGGFNTKEQLKQVEMFLQDHPLDEGRKSQTELLALEKIEENMMSTSMTASTVNNIQVKIKSWLDRALTKEKSKRRSMITLIG